MNILMVLSDHYFPPDIRVEKEAKSLIRDGHAVYLLAKRKAGQPREETVKGIKVIRFKQPLHTIPKFGNGLYYILFRFTLFFVIYTTAKKIKAEALHVHDLPLGTASLAAGTALGISVIYDRHENYRDMFLANNRDIFSRLISLPFSLEENIIIRRASATITVITEAQERLKSKISRDTVYVVSNTADIEEMDSAARDFGLVKNGKFTLSYVGGFSRHRGLENFIQGFALAAKESIDDLRLFLVGAGETRKRLEDQVQKLGMEEKVVFTGWVPLAVSLEYIAKSDVCLIPYDSTPHTNYTIPHKLFQYMYYEKPVLGSDVLPLKRILNECKCGMVFRAGDPEDVKNKIVYLYKNRELLAEMGRNGKKAVLDKYNWEKDAEVLKRIYRSIRES